TPAAGRPQRRLLTRHHAPPPAGGALVSIPLFYAFPRCFRIVLIGLLLESMAAVVLLSLKKIQRDKEIPFSPFLLLGMGVTLCF
ncbi:MAG: hypothetical protein K2N37_01785, partial [Lachnospiraceae bacterium]|nr:hypothetical protein [Lachnospiraceae bacterium]